MNRGSCCFGAGEFYDESRKRVKRSSASRMLAEALVDNFARLRLNRSRLRRDEMKSFAVCSQPACAKTGTGISTTSHAASSRSNFDINIA
jgi:hypothetical protein